ncbi:MAG: M20/M25/M40 family metallo-hydrolase, partial [Caldilineaceae bacterium]|nr:M20/M25/M40 family metallo-hydrolase [Caldilineaceae bacterium]
MLTTNSRFLRSGRHWRRLLSVTLIIALIAPMLGSPTTRGQDEAPLDVPFGPVLFLVTAGGEAPPADLPPTTTVHARLEEPDQVLWIASGATGDPDTVAAAGLPVAVLDDDTTGDVYYLADATALDAASIAATVATVLWSGANHLVVATTLDGELALVESLPAQGVALTLIAPLPLAPPGVVDAAAAFPTPAAVADPAIATLLAQVTTAELQDLVNKLSGQTPVTVGGAQVTLNTRYTFASRIRDAEQFVYEYYQSLGIPVQYANWTYGNYSGRNVVAEVRGSSQPERVFIVGGHLDSISNVPYSNAPGADDNATGTAATMVLARLLHDYQPAMTVRFVHFTAEEQGHWGSKVYAASLRQRGEQVAGFFDLDMIGWDGNGDRVVEIHTAYGPKSNALADQYLERNTRYAVGLTFERKTGTASRFSDHASFWDNDYAS